MNARKGQESRRMPRFWLSSEVSDAAIHQDGRQRRQVGSGAGGKRSVQRKIAPFRHIDLEMHSRIHQGGVTKPLQSTTGIQQEDGA